jgi:transcriptional regulator with XRE-family HTH domain
MVSRYLHGLEEEEARLRIAEVAYQARAAAGHTQAALAARVDTKQSVISAIESGSQRPTIPTLRRVARAMDRQLTIELAVAG